ncbi:MAG: hypothetical protein FWC15_01325 [Fibromonadales bacterium]|nr:hypothetical protein [Fibromonadales bacterium]
MRSWDEYARIKCAKEEGVAIGEAKALDLMAKGYDYEQIKKILKDKYNHNLH